MIRPLNEKYLINQNRGAFCFYNFIITYNNESSIHFGDIKVYLYDLNNNANIVSCYTAYFSDYNKDLPICFNLNFYVNAGYQVELKTNGGANIEISSLQEIVV